MKIKNVLILGFLFFLPLCVLSQIQIGNDLDGNESDYFGSSVDLSANGKRVAIDAFGYISILEENNGTWIPIGNDSTGGGMGNEEGVAVSLSYDGKRIAINGKDDIGYVRIFEEINNVWIQVGNDIVGGGTIGSFGRSIDLSADGKRIVIGDGGGSSTNGVYSGKMKIFEENNNNWEQVGDDINGEAAYDEAGKVSISSNGKRVAFGALLNSGNGDHAGHTRIFRETVNGEWVQVGNDIDGVASEDGSGRSISLSNNGKRIAIGAAGHDENGINSGHVRIFEENNFVWTQVGSDIYGEESLNGCGASVSLSGDGTRLVIGSPGNIVNGLHSGKARIFEEQADGWIQLGQDLYGEGEGDAFGNSSVISKDGKRVVVSAWNNDGNGHNAGHVRIFGDLNTLPTSLPNVIEKQDIHIFPNPTQEEFHIQIDDLQESNIHIMIRDCLGRVILDKQMKNIGTGFKESFSINTKGIYFVSVQIGEEVNTYKLIVTQN